jgi:hypothetical protein
MGKIYIITLVLLILFLNNYYCYSQEDILDKIHKIKLEKLVDKLEIEGSKAELFRNLYTSYVSEIRELNIQRVKAYKLMTESIENSEKLDSIINSLFDIEQKIHERKKLFFEEIKTVLSTKQIAKMIIFERKFNNEIRKLIKEYKKNKD